jgi:hypothetical protein
VALNSGDGSYIHVKEKTISFGRLQLKNNGIALPELFNMMLHQLVHVATKTEKVPHGQRWANMAKLSGCSMKSCGKHKNKPLKWCTGCVECKWFVYSVHRKTVKNRICKCGKKLYTIINPNFENPSLPIITKRY